jgi:transglutaminase-like putative cysteine protease
MDRLVQDIESCRTLDSESPHHFLTASPRVPIVSDIAAYTRGVISDRMTVVEAVEALGVNLHRDIEYDPDATEVYTPVEDAFRLRRGVCQDISHMMIAGLRSAGIPAAYVSGYLRTKPPEGKPRLEGADAMHAWVRAWCGLTSRWMEFDPTNAVQVALDHIVVARGRDYSDIAPIQGVLRTSGSQETKQAVDVVPLD